MDKFDRDVLRVAGAAAVSHYPELVPVAETLSHFLAQHGDVIRVSLEEFLLHLDRFAALVHHALVPFSLRRSRTVCGGGGIGCCCGGFHHATPPRETAASSSSFF